MAIKMVASITVLLVTIEAALANSLRDSVVILRRKQVGNPVNYFDKSFKEYKAGFVSRGEGWIGLEKLHQLTSTGSYGLRIRMKDWDDSTYMAVYDEFKVGRGDGYRLTVRGFNWEKSTLGDAMSHSNGMKFSTRDRNQDGTRWRNCAAKETGGWWYCGSHCGLIHLTGRHTERRRRLPGDKQIHYYWGGDRADTWDSWKGVTMELIPPS